ncbi:MAG: glycosyltransferase family 39 protein, partial [Anaerolineales bacterium]
MAAIAPPRKKWYWLFDLLFIGVLLAAGFLRFTGAGWGDLSIQHPDEDFLTSVTLGIQPVGTPADQLGIPPTLATQSWRGISSKAYPDCIVWGGYFDTNCSPLNPHNHGFSFYVYGDLPVIMTRYLATWLGQLGHLTLFGRYLSGVMDLGTLLLLFLIVRRVYNSRVALLASAFSAVAVEQIQQSHFYTTDNFVVFFMFLTLYFAVLIATGEWKSSPGKPVVDGMDEENAAKEPSPGSRIISDLKALVSNPLTLLTIGFGISLGMAAASKINAAVIAVTLPVALLVRYFQSNQRDVLNEAAGRRNMEDFLSKAFLFLIIGAVFSVLSFRVFQPYAFNGLGLDPQWLSNLREVRGQASPNSDLPWNLQWARRTHLYSFQNLTTWGLGLPLGILAWVGFLWMGWRMLKGDWRQHFLLWSWTAIYFVWQSLQYNPTMRYQLPIYPLLAMMAAW